MTKSKSLNQGNFLELLKWLADKLDGPNKVVLQNVLKDPEMTGPKTIEGLVKACARETTKLIRQDLGEENFAVIACLYTDACQNEHLVVCLRYVDTKYLLEEMWGDDKWEKVLKDVTTFCAKQDVKVPSMDDMYEPVLEPKGLLRKVKNLQHYHVEIFTSILDRALQELNDRFDEMNTDFLLNVASLDPSNSFYPYNKDKLLKLARSYPEDFSNTDLLHLPSHLTRFIADMHEDERFRKVKSFVELSVMLVKTKKSLKHPIVYKLLKLALVLPIATASVERIFSAMDLVKSKLANRVGEQLLNDCLVTFIEMEVFMQVKDEALASCFQVIVGA